MARNAHATGKAHCATSSLVVEVEHGVPVTLRDALSEDEWLRVFRGELRLADFERPFGEHR